MHVGFATPGVPTFRHMTNSPAARIRPTVAAVAVGAVGLALATPLGAPATATPAPPNQHQHRHEDRAGRVVPFTTAAVSDTPGGGHAVSWKARGVERVELYVASSPDA